VEHPGEREIVDVQRPPGDLLAPLLARDVPSDGSGSPSGAHGWARMLPQGEGRRYSPKRSIGRQPIPACSQIGSRSATLRP
jgi:hypothetical protein